MQAAIAIVGILGTNSSPMSVASSRSTIVISVPVAIVRSLIRMNIIQARSRRFTNAARHRTASQLVLKFYHLSDGSNAKFAIVLVSAATVHGQ
eukprot:6178507-Pleurochrysis_carterae.AAC.1